MLPWKECRLTKRELVIEVASKLGLTQNEVSAVVQETLDSITAALVEGHRLEIRNFGVFEVKERDARIGRNPRTGEEVPIAKKRVAAFRPGKALKEWIQAGPGHKPHHLFRENDVDGAPGTRTPIHEEESTPAAVSPPEGLPARQADAESTSTSSDGGHRQPPL